MNPLLLLNIIRSQYFKDALVILAVLFGIWFIYHKGEEATQKLWDADKLLVQAEIEKLKGKQGEVTIKEVIKYVDRVKVVEGKTKTITEYVDKYITTDSNKGCVIPNNAVTIIDAAARNTPLPSAAAVAPIDVKPLIKPIPLTGVPSK
jgi:hypothetical protein